MKTASFIPFIFVLSSDDLGRLKTEINIGEGDQSETAVNGQKIVYTYGSSGDIIKREYYDVQASLGSIFTRQTVVRTDSFGYTNSNWKKQCDSTNINGVSSALSYDAIGNPLTYRDGMQMTWQNGRQLKKLTAPNGKMLQFSYDLNGQRQAKIERSYGNVVHTTKYFYDGTKLAGEKKDDTIVWYDYDENGAPVGMRVNGLDYIFRKNLQGDITGIYNSSAELIVEYTYSDAWGAGVTVSGSAASTIGMYNSFRYRGYYYDTESGLYYLNSRYYDPVACRFINADGYVSTGQGNSGHNMYSYCGNNPVMRVDKAGQFWGLFTLGAVFVGSLLLSGCSAEPAQPPNPRKDLATAPNLDVDTAPPNSYNCYGNGIGKRIVANPTGYKPGDSTRKTFEAVKNDLGRENVRELTAFNDYVSPYEFKVAMKCGPNDYHFIRLTKNGWYNKSGSVYPGMYVDKSVVEKDIWSALAIINGELYNGEPYYTDETIYFAVKVGWDVK